MKKYIILIPILLSAVLSACSDEPDHGHEQEVSEGHEDAEPQKGQHGGRLMQKDGVSVELAIAEDGTPPKFQAWIYRDGKALPPKSGQVEIKIQRLGLPAESHILKPQPDGSLMAATIVGEPHSFDVEVLAGIENKNLRWAYQSYEGRTEIGADIAAQSGIKTEPAGPGEIADEHEVQGLLTPVEGRSAVIMARFPGPIKSLHANVGDSVRAGQVMATVESNISLTNYQVKSPISGVVMSRSAAVGAVADGGTALFEVADLSKIWVDLHVFGADAQHIKAGVPVEVTRMSDGLKTVVTLERVLPGTSTASQSAVARATIDNSDGLWRPGSAVKARITVDRSQVALIVPIAALQTFRDWDVVFIKVGDTYEIRPVEMDRRDATHVEIISGINPGDLVVVEQSYLVKADIEKSGASHDH
jgi:cobalt-zinc-cadmium efflux system membrane fusion protein